MALTRLVATLPIGLRRTTLSYLLLLALLLAACTTPVPTTSAGVETTAAPVAATTTASASLFPLTITDAAGQEFTFDAPPKIGCWWSGCTEIMADLGVVPHAASYNDTNENSAFFYPAGMPTHKIEDPRNPELWAAAEVDLLVMRVPADPGYDALKAAAPIFYLHHPSFGESSQSGYQALLENLRIMGQVTGKPEAAAAAITRFDNVLAHLKALATPETQARTVAVLWDDTVYRTIDQTSPFCVAIAELGLGQCIEGPFWEEISAETFLAADPDWIAYQSVDGSHDARTDPVWPQLAAVKAGQVYDTMGYYYCCGARELIHTLQEFAHFTLPEANIPAPGPWLDYDPLQSPLVQPLETASAPAATGTRTVEHDLGVTEVPVNPQRIVAINSASIELLATLGIKPVGIAPWIGAGNPVAVAPHISAAMDLTDVTLVGDANQPNLEAIAALQPDLILMSGGGYYQELYDQVSQIAPTVAYAAWPEDSPRSYWKEFFISTATAMGKETEAQAAIDAWQARIAEFKTAAAVDETELSVIRLMPDSIMAYQKGSYSGTVLEDVGVKQIESQEVVDFAADISMEQIPQIDGDILLLIQSDPNAAIYNQLLTSPLWRQLGAVQADQVYLVNTDVWIGGDGYISANLILDDLARLFLEDGAGMTKAE